MFIHIMFIYSNFYIFFFNIRRNQVKFIFKHHAEMFVSREHYIMRLINLIIEEYRIMLQAIRVVKLT